MIEYGLKVPDVGHYGPHDKRNVSGNAVTLEDLGTFGCALGKACVRTPRPTILRCSVFPSRVLTRAPETYGTILSCKPQRTRHSYKQLFTVYW